MSVPAYDSFSKEYSSEETCIQALFAARWPSGFRCPACGYSEFYTVSTRRLPLYQCASPCCRHQTSITAGTIMEGSRTPLTRWFQALFWLSQPSGISSLGLSQLLDVTYKTAWLMTHKIRHAMKQEVEQQPLTGEVRVERFYYGTPMYLDAQQPLLLGGSQDDSGDPIAIKIHQPNPDHVDVKTLSIQRIGVEEFIANHTHAHSVDVKKLYEKSLPGFSRIKFRVSAWLNLTFRGIGPKHLQAYLHEYVFRWNKQGSGLRSVFGQTLQWCVSTKVLIGKELTRHKPVLPRPWHAFKSKSAWKGRHLSNWFDS
ncbi:transposase [Cohnella sp. AR92]|uniref:transposase n=1 Tax=Cohnella sp. AR92 TaxID=648716 RepID=UPI000F8C593E|nr:transposase [Cohnella sp. AR92]RUS48361.1 transposase [Cohnella sp. AR92]